ncbi:MAG: diguanylate cyclase, partial [Ruminococcus sp.]|nr:diguanylate cyclase [Ruminococcus sp.]
VQAVTMTNERCVRAGGDEFFIIGVGDYDESDMNKRTDKFAKIMNEFSDNSGKPYIISASMGCAIGAKDSFDETLSAADKAMYFVKQKKKKHND